METMIRIPAYMLGFMIAMIALETCIIARVAWQLSRLKYVLGLRVLMGGQSKQDRARKDGS